MIWALPYFLLGALTFTGQQLPGLWVSPSKGFTGEVSVNFRQADLDGDGKTDLVFGRKVFFQRDGAFPEDAQAPLPDFHESPVLDVCEGAVYVRLQGRLLILQWDGKEWHKVLDQPLAWPEEETASQEYAKLENQGVLGLGSFQRFVFTLQDDKSPALAAVGPDGVQLYRKQGETYAAYKHYNVLPELTLAERAEQTLWPAAARRIGVPPREMSCRLLVEAAALSVISSEDAENGRYNYRCVSYPLAGEDLHTTERTYGPVPAYLRPCRLNQEPRLAFAGGRWQVSESPLLPELVYETCATLDGGKTFHVRRSRSFQNFRPQASFVDFDGDGRMDMVTESTGLFDGGVRETVARFLTQDRVEHEVALYRQTEAGFAEKPSARARFTLGLGKAPVYGSGDFARYQMGDLVNVTGDFNGDHFRDIVVQDQPGHVAIYLSSEWKIPAKPAAAIAFANRGIFSVFDLNGDGRSDIILRGSDKGAEKKVEPVMVYFSRESTP